MPKVKAEQAVQVILDELKSSMVRGERIEIRGFGAFVVRPRKRGFGRNLKTGQVVPILPGRTVRFKPSKALGRQEPQGGKCAMSEEDLKASWRALGKSV